MKLAMVLCLVLAAACKTDKTEAPAATPSAAADESSAPKRSGKINLPPRMPAAPGPGGAEAQRERGPAPDDPFAGREDFANMSEEERAARREQREQLREERRKERMERLDVDKDGQISPEEMAAGRKQRVEDMRTRFDSNNDGKLTVEELGTGRMGRRLDAKAADTNGDGNISADELNTALDKQRERYRKMREGGEQPPRE